MALHFDEFEFFRRRHRLIDAMEAKGLDGMLLFQQESMYWLTGYDTFGFCFFQCLYIGADGTMAVLTRSADLRQAQHTSILKDIRIWKDGKDANPSVDLVAMVKDLGGTGKRLGVEYDAYGLSHFQGKRLEAAFEGHGTLIDASDIVTRLRAIKSADEIRHERRTVVGIIPPIIVSPLNVLTTEFRLARRVGSCTATGTEICQAGCCLEDIGQRQALVEFGQVGLAGGEAFRPRCSNEIHEAFRETVVAPRHLKNICSGYDEHGQCYYKEPLHFSIV